ncbi:BON domain-containing protein [Thalassotalea euphylliae]|uniref:BON domain-containing protein n=1 Tax=Thalassotalea euphylliae TaxID=1655234 RepID=UPI0036284503
MKRITPTLVFAAVLTGASMSVLADNTEQKWKDNALDAWIDGKAETTLLLNTNLNSFDINTDVESQHVTLTGMVDTNVEKSLAEELIAGLDGVNSVDNQLTVKDRSGDTMQALTDTKITTVVKTRLLLDSDVNGTAIDVAAQEGVVILSGVVESSAEEDLAISIAENTSDVARVVDRLDVAK